MNLHGANYIAGKLSKNGTTQFQTFDPRENKNLETDFFETTDEEIAALRAEVRGQYETQSDPYYATSRLWDDGLIDPVDTRDALGLCLALATRQDEPTPGPGLVYRM